MKRPSVSSAQAISLDFGQLYEVLPGLPLRVSASTAQRVAAAAIAPMVTVSVALALSSDHLQRPVVSALYWGYLTAAPMAIGLYWWNRRPASRFGPLLVVFGILVWVVSLESSDWALPFDVGVLAEAPMFVLTFYLFLAFPMGRLEPAAARWLMGALAVAVVGFFLPWALFSPVIAGGGPLTRCAPGCPDNVLQLGSAPGLVEWAGKAETYSALAITIGALVIYAVRLRGASRPQRRALMAVAVTSLLFLPAYFTFNFAAWILYLDQKTLDTLAWGIVGARILLPLGFLVALLQAERFAGRALHVLLERLATRPTAEQWRDTIASALDDPELRLGFYDPGSSCFRGPDGEEMRPPLPWSGRAWVPVERRRDAVAAMDVDETLAEDPELVRAAVAATIVAVEHGHLEGQLRASQARIVQAGDAERRRIERDLHDGAQQRLLALRIHLSLATERVDHEEREVLAALGVEIDEAIAELRRVAHGIYPPSLERGIGPALAAIARRSPIPVRVEGAWLGRQPAAIERTVYFCCVECLQNAAKHAGPGASATVRLDEREGQVRFLVEDDGAGFDPETVQPGAGLGNLADRVGAVRGTLHIDASPGGGTRITGMIPGARR